MAPRHSGETLTEADGANWRCRSSNDFGGAADGNAMSVLVEGCFKRYGEEIGSNVKKFMVKDSEGSVEKMFLANPRVERKIYIC